jgi:hypothetical protein
LFVQLKIKIIIFLLICHHGMIYALMLLKAPNPLEGEAKMTDIQLPAGKFVPPLQPNPDISRVVQNNLTTAPAQPNVSFSDTLQSRMSKMSAVQSAPQTASQTPASTQTPGLQVIPIPETMPSNLTTGPQFESGFINNWQQYNATGSHAATPQPAAPIRTASQPAMNAAMMNANAAAAPVQSQALPYQNKYQSTQAAESAQPTQAMNSVLARGLGQAYNVSSEQIPEEPVYVPAPEVVLTPEEAAQLDAIIAGQPMQQTNAANKNSKLDSQSQQDQPQNNLTKQSNDSKENKGFFKSVGSFFKNIASGLTLGFYRPDNEPAMQGIARVAEPVKRIVWDAPKSLLVDAPVGAYHSMKGAFDGDGETDSQSSLAMNQQQRQLVDVGERVIASRRMDTYITGSKLRSSRLS